MVIPNGKEDQNGLFGWKWELRGKALEVLGNPIIREAFVGQSKPFPKIPKEFN